MIQYFNTFLDDERLLLTAFELSDNRSVVGSSLIHKLYSHDSPQSQSP